MLSQKQEILLDSILDTILVTMLDLNLSHTDLAKTLNHFMIEFEFALVRYQANKQNK